MRTALLALLATTAFAGTSGAAPRRALVLSGQNNHDWRATSAAVKAALDASGAVTADVTESPQTLTADALAPYDVLVGNWNAFAPRGGAAVDWPPAARAAILDFVRNGKGHVVIHAGGSSFMDWPEYQQMIGGASWKMGVTRHGPQHDFPVRLTSAAHPVTQGMEPFRTRDELWIDAKLDDAVTVLAEGQAADGSWQPVAAVNAFGKGRNFILLLGHDVAALENPGCRDLLVRGTEWAAAGSITVPPLTARPTADAVLPQIAAWKHGASRAPLLALEDLVARTTATPDRAALASRLAAALAGDASGEARAFLCAMLGLVGTPAELPALEAAAKDPGTATAARGAIDRIRGDVLRTLTPSKSAARSHDAIAADLESNDSERQDAALRAIATAGPGDFADLLSAKAGQLSPRPLTRALVLLGQSGSDKARETVRRALAHEDPHVRREAAAATAELGDAGALDALLKLLSSRDAGDRRAAVDAIRSLRDASVDARLVEALAQGGDAARPIAEALAARATHTSNPAALLLKKAGGAGNAAAPLLQAVGLVGAPSDVPALLPRLADTNAATVAAALEAIRQIHLRAGADPVDTVRRALSGADARVRPGLIALLDLSKSPECLVILRKTLGDVDIEARLAALRVLSKWPDNTPIEDVQRIAAQAADPREKGLALRAVAAMSKAVYGPNLARGAKADSPDGLEKDGHADGDEAGIDGDLKTYWDEADGQPLYRYRVTLPKPAAVSTLRITGWKHHEYAPKDFDVLCDGKIVTGVRDAVYEENVLVVPFDPVRATTVELRITGYYARSPAIRELEIFGPPPATGATPEARK
jgi:hypothetical protein